METKEIELQKTTIELQQQLAGLQEKGAYNDYINPEVKQKNIISTDDIPMPQPENSINDSNENGIFPHHSRFEPSSSRTIIFDTKDLFLS